MSRGEKISLAKMRPGFPWDPRWFELRLNHGENFRVPGPHSRCGQGLLAEGRRVTLDGSHSPPILAARIFPSVDMGKGVFSAKSDFFTHAELCAMRHALRAMMRQDLQPYGSLARAVKLTKENPLPGAQLEAPVLDENDLGRADEG